MYPVNYVDSRSRFRHAAAALGAVLLSFPIASERFGDLSIEVALIGSAALPAIVLSSGLHGVEARVGAAIQLAWMEAHRQHPVPGRFILIHAINPYGFAMGRRVDEHNVDLNRNFLNHANDLPATHTVDVAAPDTSGYVRFNGLLNPANAPKRVDGFVLQALGYLAREGVHQLQGAIVTGQFEFDKGLFYGGSRTSCSVKIIQQHIHQWVGDSSHVCHIDVHTGLGRFAECQLLVQTSPGSEDYRWFEKTFGAEELVSTATAGKNAYQPIGAMGNWLTAHFAERPYYFVTAEFGTYSAIRMLSALRRENQAFHYTAVESQSRTLARQRLERCFCPSSSFWQRQVLQRAGNLIQQVSHELYVT